MGYKPGLALFPVAGEELIEPAPRDVVGRRDLGDAAALHEHGVDDVASQIHAHTSSSWCPLCLATCVRDVLKSDTSVPTPLWK